MKKTTSRVLDKIVKNTGSLFPPLNPNPNPKMHKIKGDAGSSENIIFLNDKKTLGK